MMKMTRRSAMKRSWTTIKIKAMMTIRIEVIGFMPWSLSYAFMEKHLRFPSDVLHLGVAISADLVSCKTHQIARSFRGSEGQF